MADQHVFKGSEQVRDNGAGGVEERPQSLNGKRPLDTAMDNDTARDMNASKRTKTLTVQNGVEHSSTASAKWPLQSNRGVAIHNGLAEGSRLTEPKSAMIDSHGRRNGSNVKETVISANNVKRPRQDFHNSERPIKQEAVLAGQELRGQNENVRPMAEDGQAGEPEIITLSDSEDEFQEVLSKAMSHDSSSLHTYKLLKHYQNQLRAEESKLILLQKLRMSLTKVEKQASTAAVNADASSKAADAKSGAVSSQRTSGGNAPPPLKRGQNQSQYGVANSHTSHHKATHHHHPTPAEKTKAANHSNGPSSGGPPPLVNMAKSSSHTSGGSSGSYNYQSTSSQSKKAAAPPKLTPEQTLAAAKMALRKQLEQALVQVPSPKPPPPEVNFLPSLASGEFIYLIGMEEVVKQLLSTDQRDVKFVFNPFSCVQCGTDFTPVWKRDKPGSKNVICERCITSNQKRVLKQDHTAKLKAVFSKALQKEQEIERRVAAGSPLSDMPGLAATVVRHQSSTSATAAAPSMPQLTAQHAQSSPSPNSQLSTTQLHQQALLQVQAEQMRAMIAAQMLPYQLYSGVNVPNKQAAELQRKYLLDMINQNRSSSWNT